MKLGAAVPGAIRERPVQTGNGVHRVLLSWIWWRVGEGGGGLLMLWKGVLVGIYCRENRGMGRGPMDCC